MASLSRTLLRTRIISSSGFHRVKVFPHLVISLTFAVYGAIFAAYHHKFGNGIGALAIIPVIAASWYFGPVGGVITVLASLIVNIVVLLYEGHSLAPLYQSPGSLSGVFSLFLCAVAVGRFVTILHQRRDAILKLQQYEAERESHTSFLEQLNQITSRALATDSLESTLEILTEQIANLFHADDAFFSLWDDVKEVPIPTIACGSMRDIYPYMQFEPGDVSLTASVMKAGHPVFVTDLEDSVYISPHIAALFPSHSMLAIPLITPHHRLGALLLGYNERHVWDNDDLVHAGIIAEHVALVVSKTRLLEEERKRVRQLTALHDVALITIEADSEDQLIEHVTDIIGKNLFSDNFGIMLLDERADMLRAHPSYRFYMSEDLKTQDVRVGAGITGHVARSGQPRRIGNVRRIPEYIDMDDRTISELSVPIKFKERILGVINAESTKRDAFSDEDERLLVTLAGQLATAIEQLRKAESERFILDQLAHDKDLIYSIAQITSQIERSLKADQIIQTMGQELEKIGLTCIMAIYDPNRKNFTLNYTSLPTHLLSIVEAGLGYPLVEYTFPRRRLDAILIEEDLLRPNVISNPKEEIKTIFTRLNEANISVVLKKIGVTDAVEPLRLPLVFEKNLLGMLWIWGEGVTHSDLPILSIFAKQIGMTLERARLFDEVQSLALTDALTGLQNRRSLFELGRIEFSRAQRMQRPFSCMMLDIDHFKKVNDDYGHQIGDEVLQEFGRRCKLHVREVDLIGRYGGEEFMVLLPETDCDMAVLVAERFRKLIAENPIETSVDILDITISVGVATKNDQTTHLDTLIARADQALYISKHKGRNRVSLST